MSEIVGDNRFEVIANAKKHLLEATNIDTSEDEMKVLDNILFRCWQMGWLDKYDEKEPKTGEWTRNFDGNEMNDLISRQAALEAIGEKPFAGTADEYDYEQGLQNQWERDVVAIKILPSAQSEPIRINLNETIKVKLTDWGKEIYYHQYDRINRIIGREICKPKFPKEGENGYTEFQLWCFIELYGEHMAMTLPNVIEPLEIVYER